MLLLFAFIAAAHTIWAIVGGTKRLWIQKEEYGADAVR